MEPKLTLEEILIKDICKSMTEYFDTVFYCQDCSGVMVSNLECKSCMGEDKTGYPLFCPKCNFCCGC